MHGTYALYLYKNSDATFVEELIENLTNMVDGFYNDEDLGLYVNFVIRGTLDGKPIVWTEPEP